MKNKRNDVSAPLDIDLTYTFKERYIVTNLLTFYRTFIFFFLALDITLFILLAILLREDFYFLIAISIVTYFEQFSKG